MKELEMEGPTVEAAVEQALRSLDASLSDVDVEVLDQGSRGILGILGGRSARVRVRVHPDGSEEAGQTGVPERPEKESERVNESADATEHENRVEEFLHDVLRLMRVDAEVARVDRDEERQTVAVELTGPEVGILIGRRGQTLDALQYLTNIAGNRGARERTRVTLDAERFRARREESLRGLAVRTASRVKATGQPVALDSMSALDRRTVHLALAEEPGVTTFSEGEEPHRKVIVKKASEELPVERPQ